MMPVKDKAGENRIGQGEGQTTMQRHPNGELWGPTLGRSGQAWFPSLLSYWLRLPRQNVASEATVGCEGVAAGGCQLTALLPPEGQVLF